MNAAKALLTVKGRPTSESHGVCGESIGDRTSLAYEMVTFKPGGVLAALCDYLGETSSNDRYSLKHLLYNLPYIHRAYNLTYPSSPDLFTRIVQPQFVYKVGSSESWFYAQIENPRYATNGKTGRLPPGYERDVGIADRFVIRAKKRFRWTRGKGALPENLKRLRDYHRTIRQHVHYIHGPSTLWYIKRGSDRLEIIDRGTLTLAFAGMHRLSELARYNPMVLARHFDCQHNWLLSEFIATAPYQFIDEISSEITGQEFMIPAGRPVR